MARVGQALGLALCAAVLVAAIVPSAEADAPATPSDVQLHLGEYYFNPSIVKHRGVYLATARTAEMKKIDKTTWWFNDGFMCMSTTPGFKSASCRKFDPWQGRFSECLWGSERKAAEVDTQGLEDPKLFVWPGKGVYAIFGRKPEAVGPSPYCRDPVFVQFMVQVVAEGPADEWSIHKPRELSLGAFAPAIRAESGGHHGPVKEKNWMPWVHDGQLYMTYSVAPHRVMRINSQGVAVQQFVTTNEALFDRFEGEDVHGGPPLVLVDPAAVAAAGGEYPQGAQKEPYYLGILHYFRTYGEGASKVKSYHHFAYKMEARAPFRVCAVSDEIPLVTRKRAGGAGALAGGWTHQRIWKDTSQTAYASGLFLDGDKVLLSYGSSDIDARLLALSLTDVEALFADSPYDCASGVVLDAGSGEQARAAAAAGGNGGARSVAAAAAAGGEDGDGDEEVAQRRHYRARRRAHRRERSFM